MRSLPVFVLTRLVSVAVVVLTVTVITFVMLHVLRRESFPDSRPLLAQLAEYLERVFLHYDFGISWDRQSRPVAEMLSKTVPADVSLLGGGLLVGVVAGMAGGAICIARPGTLVARALEAAAAFFIIAPVYWVGLVIILVFNEEFGVVGVPLFDTNNYAPLSENPLRWLQGLLVPWLVLGAPLAALVLRMTRAAMAEIRHEDYLRTAVAKGLPERLVLRRHALPAASAPALTLAAANMTTMLTNLVLIEHVFSIPGVFRLTTQAISDANFPLLQAMTVVAAILVVSANLVMDVLHAAIDPRVRMAR